MARHHHDPNQDPQHAHPLKHVQSSPSPSTLARLKRSWTADACRRHRSFDECCDVAVAAQDPSNPRGLPPAAYLQEAYAIVSEYPYVVGLAWYDFLTYNGNAPWAIIGADGQPGATFEALRQVETS